LFKSALDPNADDVGETTTIVWVNKNVIMKKVKERGASIIRMMRLHTNLGLKINSGSAKQKTGLYRSTHPPWHFLHWNWIWMLIYNIILDKPVLARSLKSTRSKTRFWIKSIFNLSLTLNRQTPSNLSNAFSRLTVFHKLFFATMPMLEGVNDLSVFVRLCLCNF